MFKKNQKGFTLIELLIVVAIIAILAAIAIPQFAAYRIRGFNASANSDVRNLATAEEALFADTQGYGSLANAALGVGNCVAATLLAGAAGGYQAATTAAAGAKIMNARGSVGFAMGNQVGIGAAGVVDAASNMCTSYVLVSKHTAGDRCFGRETDSSSMYSSSATIAQALAAGDVPAAVAGSIDLVLAGSGQCTSWLTM